MIRDRATPNFEVAPNQLAFFAQCVCFLVQHAPCRHASRVATIHSVAAVKIGQRIREARHRLNISLEDLGALSEISWTTIGKIERGASSPTAETLVRLATALEVDPGDFLTAVTSDDYGRRVHQLTARDLIAARADGGRAKG